MDNLPESNCTEIPIISADDRIDKSLERATHENIVL